MDGPMRLPPWSSRSLLVVCLASAVACTDGAKSAASASPDSGAPQAPSPSNDGGVASEACEAAGPVLTTLTTDDGILLTADLYTTGKRGGPAAVLLHMIPPSNDRSNYPAAFITALVSRGVAVLNVDRRGAGGSGGVARDAYTGSKGALDAKAAVGLLRAHACAFDETRVAVVGASNGTTTAVDYAVSAATPPRALVLLTGGTYTESQTTIADHRPLLGSIPTLFVFSTAESSWSKGFSSGAPATWRFEEYPNGAHGTGMFAAEPTSIDSVASFVAASLAATN